MLKPIRKHRFHVSTRTPKSLQNDLQKGALGSQFGTQNGKSALQEVIKKKHEKKNYLRTVFAPRGAIVVFEALTYANGVVYNV